MIRPTAITTALLLCVATAWAASPLKFGGESRDLGKIARKESHRSGIPFRQRLTYAGGDNRSQNPLRVYQSAFPVAPGNGRRRRLADGSFQCHGERELSIKKITITTSSGEQTLAIRALWSDKPDTKRKRQTYMRIGFDAKRMFRNNSGLGNYSRSTLELMKKYYPQNSWPAPTPPTTKNNVGFVIPEGVETVTPSGLLGDVAPSLWRSLSMARDIRRRKCDIYHGLSNELPLDIRHSGAKSVVTVRPYFRTLPQPIQKGGPYALYLQIQKELPTGRPNNSHKPTDLKATHGFWGIPKEVIDVVYQGCNPIFYKNAPPTKIP